MTMFFVKKSKPFWWTSMLQIVFYLLVEKVLDKMEIRLELAWNSWTFVFFRRRRMTKKSFHTKRYDKQTNPDFQDCG
jgi:hypothetical protein